MALSSYTELKAAIADNAHRTDLTTQIVDAITMAEARMYDMLILKNMESDETLTLSVGVNYVALPASFISPIEFWLIVDSERVRLPAILPQDLPYYTTNSRPRFWAIDGANVRFDCPSDSAYSARLRCLIKSNLSGSVASNYLLARRPDIYLAASIVELARYMGNDKLFAMWEPKFLQACRELKNAENRNKTIAPLRTDIGGHGRSNILLGD